MWLASPGATRRSPVAIVVSHFHPSIGQRVEWQHPRDFDSEGVEFKSMPSGFDACEQVPPARLAHVRTALPGLCYVRQDFVFFRHAQLYALACFHRLQTNSDSEREVRMRSVVVFAQELAALQAPELASTLLQHAKRLNATPDATAPLFELLQPKSRFSWGKTSNSGQYQLGAGQLLSLTSQLRARIFTLWKALLLNRSAPTRTPWHAGVRWARCAC